MWGATLSNADGRRGRARAHALQETEAALRLAARVPYDFLVVHLGQPDDAVAAAERQPARCGAAQPRGARTRCAGDAGVQLALEVIPNQLSTAEAPRAI